MNSEACGARADMDPKNIVWPFGFLSRSRVLLSALVGLGCAFCACAASAQTTTNCQPTIIGMPSAGVTCRSDAPTADAQSFSWKDVPTTPCSGFQKALPANLAFCAARDVATRRKAVGDLIAAGQCSDALKSALGTGDLGFARDVREFCGGK